jgi:hypothetical protein
MLTSKPIKTKRGKQPPPYGVYRCPLCQEKLRLGASLSCKCGYKET